MILASRAIIINRNEYKSYLQIVLFCSSFKYNVIISNIIEILVYFIFVVTVIPTGVATNLEGFWMPNDW